MCSDVAAMADGGFLLAAKMHGLIEYNADGIEMGHWLPKRKRPATGENDWVSTVDVLDDGRAVVDVQYARLVVLLVRDSNPSGGDTWTESRIFKLTRFPPWMLAVQADVIAVSECKIDPDVTQWLPDDYDGLVPGPNLCVITVDGRRLSSRELEYDIFALAVTDVAVITSSSSREVAKSEGSIGYFRLESHSHNGDFLWRQQQDEPIDDLCVSPVEHLIYAALSKSRQVVTISSVDGSPSEGSKVLILKHNGEPGEGLAEPTRLSLRQGKDAFLVVLSAPDFKTIFTYRAKR